jgi:hypothetical protein
VSEGKKVRWTIASARQHLPTVVGLAAREPQDIYRRDTLVARIVSPEPGQAPRPKPTPAEIFAEMQRICAEDNYTLEVAPRRDRPNPFAPPRSKAARKRKRKA